MVRLATDKEDTMNDRSTRRRWTSPTRAGATALVLSLGVMAGLPAQAEPAPEGSSSVEAVSQTLSTTMETTTENVPAAKTGTVMATTQRMSAPTLNSIQSGTWAKGTRLTLNCHARGQAVSGYYSPWVPGGKSNIWYKTSSGQWAADIDLSTGSNNPVVPLCSSIKWGATRTGNSGAPGQCTWGAYAKFKAYTTTYPALTGNAKDWLGSAARTGWTTSSNPRVNSIVVFQPRVHGADPTYGHVGWVTKVTNRSDGGKNVTFVEMNYNGQLGKWNTRTVKHVSGMGYIWAPPR